MTKEAKNRKNWGSLDTQAYITVHNLMLDYTGLHSHTQPYKGLNKLAQPYIGLYKPPSPCTTLHKLTQVYTIVHKIYRGYYMPARGYEFYLRVVNSISHEWSLRSLVRYRVGHEKIKFISISGYVIFCLLYKHQWNAKPFDFNIFNGLKVERVVTKHGTSTRP